MSHQPLTPEREAEIRQTLTRFDPYFGWNFHYHKDVGELLAEIDRLRSQPCQPPGCPATRAVSRLSKRTILWDGAGEVIWQAELAPISGEPQLSSRERIIELFKTAKGPLYYTDISDRLKMDLEEVVTETQKLEREGIVGEKPSEPQPSDTSKRCDKSA